MRFLACPGFSTLTRLCCAQSKLGGGEGIEGMYGSIKRVGMRKVLQSLMQHCDFDTKAHFLDVGAGLGRYRPLLLLSPRPHALPERRSGRWCQPGQVSDAAWLSSCIPSSQLHHMHPDSAHCRGLPQSCCRPKATAACAAGAMYGSLQRALIAM